MRKHVPLVVLEELKAYAESVLGNFPGKDALVNPKTLLDLVHATENAYKYKQEPQKSVVDQIWEILNQGDHFAYKGGPWHRATMALAEAVEWLERWGPEENASVVQFSSGVVEDLKHSILAILKGEKTGNLPKKDDIPF